MKITPAQRRALRALYETRQPVASRMTMHALGEKNLATYDCDTDKWTITKRGEKEWEGIAKEYFANNRDLYTGGHRGRNKGDNLRGDARTATATEGDLPRRSSGRSDS